MAWRRLPFPISLTDSALSSSYQKLEAEAGITAMDEEDKVKRAEEITQSRILSQDDFQKIRIRQISKTMGADHRKEKRRAKVEEAPHERCNYYFSCYK